MRCGGFQKGVDQHRLDERMLGKFHKRCRVGFLFEERGLLLRTQFTIRRLSAGSIKFAKGVDNRSDLGNLKSRTSSSLPAQHRPPACTVPSAAAYRPGVCHGFGQAYLRSAPDRSARQDTAVASSRLSRLLDPVLGQGGLRLAVSCANSSIG